MQTVKTIDVKGLTHEEKERTIFPAFEEIGVNESIRMLFDFHPLPLVYMLNARQEFEVSYEKEGPEEWILNIKRTAPSVSSVRRKQEFKELLEELREKGLEPQVKEKAKKIFQSLDAKTLGLLEQELIQEGISHEEIRESLCDIHLEVLQDSLVKKRIEVQSPHPVHTFMAEHKAILEALNQLSAAMARLKTKQSFDELGSDIELLKEISSRLVDAESHHQREEDVLFPMLKNHDVTEPVDIMKLDHEEFRQKKKTLYHYVHNWQDYSFADYKSKVLELGEYLAGELESHIFMEDNILYQIALQVLDQKEWDQVKRECDKLGYCSLTPEERQERVTELDLRPMPPFERHEKIFEIWNKLKPGEALLIINDHNPKPLWYQFEAEYKGGFEWQYEQEGPKDWIVKIQRT